MNFFKFKKKHPSSIIWIGIRVLLHSNCLYTLSSLRMTFPSPQPPPTQSGFISIPGTQIELDAGVCASGGKTAAVVLRRPARVAAWRLRLRFVSFFQIHTSRVHIDIDLLQHSSWISDECNKTINTICCVFFFKYAVRNLSFSVCVCVFVGADCGQHPCGLMLPV